MNKALVSICLTCYNQERYIGQTLDSVAAQDYEPLELVVCDDCSTDRTDAIIRAWMGKVGTERPGLKVIYKHNPTNLGIVRNYDQCFRMAHGDLRITAAGDDYYAPNKVSRFVAAWEAAGRSATIIHSGFYDVDEQGHLMTRYGARCALDPLGGTAGYAAAVFDSFPPPIETLDVEDQVYAMRAMLLGDELRIDETLTYYRKGGYSTVDVEKRSRDLKYARSMLMSMKQARHDLEVMRGVAEECRWAAVARHVDRTEAMAKTLLDLIESKWAVRRMVALLRRGRQRGRHYALSRAMLLDATYLLPERMRMGFLRLASAYLSWYDRSHVLSVVRREYRRIFRHGEFSTECK